MYNFKLKLVIANCLQICMITCYDSINDSDSDSELYADLKVFRSPRIRATKERTSVVNLILGHLKTFKLHVGPMLDKCCADRHRNPAKSYTYTPTLISSFLYIGREEQSVMDCIGGFTLCALKQA